MNVRRSDVDVALPAFVRPAPFVVPAPALADVAIEKAIQLPLRDDDLADREPRISGRLRLQVFERIDLEIGRRYLGHNERTVIRTSVRRPVTGSTTAI